jgi:hypothetical protein
MTTLDTSFEAVALGSPDTLPVTGEDIASRTEKDQRSFKRIAQYIQGQYMAGLSSRRLHAVGWIMVQSFLRNVHYFEINGTGAYRPIPQQKGKPRAVTPILRTRREHVLGFLLNNPMGVSTTPLTGSAGAIREAAHAADILNGWIEDSKARPVRKDAFEILLDEGMVGIHPYVDHFRENVFWKTLPASGLFPIPHDARNDRELHALVYAEMVTEEWLELQDKIFEAQTGQKPKMRMKDKTKTVSMGLHLNLPFVGATSSHGGKFRGALAIHAWFRSSESAPGGEYFFMLGNEIFRYLGPNDSSGGEMIKEVMPDGEIPVSLIRWSKNNRDFWGDGFCLGLVAPQISINRQMTSLERSARRNHPVMAYDVRAVVGGDIQDEESALIPINQAVFEGTQTKPLHYFPATRVGRDIGFVVELSSRFADQAAGMRSGIAYGQAEGRVEGGPAVATLSQNALSSLVPPLEEIDTGFTSAYEKTLDLLPKAWPEEKFLKLTDPPDVGRSVKVLRSQMPASEKILMHARPMVPGGRNSLISILFQMTQMPAGPDGKPGTELKPGEFRRALTELGFLPPGLDTANRAEARIRQRIRLLIGDGQKPAIPPSEPGRVEDRLIMENHRLSIEMLKDAILDEAWHTYSPEVQYALVQQRDFHRSFMHGETQQPNQFDDDLERVEDQQAAHRLSAAEADLETTEGEFQNALGSEGLLQS